MRWEKTPEGYASGQYRITRKGAKWWARWHPQETHAKHPAFLGMHGNVQVAKAACIQHAVVRETMAKLTQGAASDPS